VLRTAIVCPPAETFARGLTTGRRGSPDLARARAQHREYVRALERCGLSIVALEPDDAHPDSTFVEDTAVVVPGGVVLSRPGAPSRRGEVGAMRGALAALVPSLWAIEAPGTLDGGDVCEIESHYLIGLSERTNAAGARQLADLVAGCGGTSACVSLTEGDGLLHLKSGLAWLGDRSVAAVGALARHSALSDYDIVAVEPEEADGANAVRINDHLLVPSGCPRLEARLRGLGLSVIALEISEFQKMEGGLSCLSLRLP
jgi:dimethylargininase